MIHSLTKKPNASRNSLLRNNLITDGDLTLIWQKLTLNSISDTDCRYIVDLLVLSDNYNCEPALGRYVPTALEGGNKVSTKQCRELFSPDRIEIPLLVSQQHSLSSYDCLIGGLHG